GSEIGQRLTPLPAWPQAVRAVYVEALARADGAISTATGWLDAHPERNTALVQASFAWFGRARDVLANAQNHTHVTNSAASLQESLQDQLQTLEGAIGQRLEWVVPTDDTDRPWEGLTAAQRLHGFGVVATALGALQQRSPDLAARVAMLRTQAEHLVARGVNAQNTQLDREGHVLPPPLSDQLRTGVIDTIAWRLHHHTPQGLDEGLGDGAEWDTLVGSLLDDARRTWNEAFQLHGGAPGTGGPSRPNDADRAPAAPAAEAAEERAAALARRVKRMSAELAQLRRHFSSTEAAEGLSDAGFAWDVTLTARGGQSREMFLRAAAPVQAAVRLSEALQAHVDTDPSGEPSRGDDTSPRATPAVGSASEWRGLRSPEELEASLRRAMASAEAAIAALRMDVGTDRVDPGAGAWEDTAEGAQPVTGAGFAQSTGQLPVEPLVSTRWRDAFLAYVTAPAQREFANLVLSSNLDDLEKPDGDVTGVLSGLVVPARVAVLGSEGSYAPLDPDVEGALDRWLVARIVGRWAHEAFAAPADPVHEVTEYNQRGEEVRHRASQLSYRDMIGEGASLRDWARAYTYERMQTTWFVPAEYTDRALTLADAAIPRVSEWMTQHPDAPNTGRVAQALTRLGTARADLEAADTFDRATRSTAALHDELLTLGGEVGERLTPLPGWRLDVQNAYDRALNRAHEAISTATGWLDTHPDDDTAAVRLSFARF
ncbi:hypothetical protein, partial [Enterococcus hirae]|uniref:hypothetical protein n=1 Tax=Enterococcus hirae TaxID=1354 RepID=UPI00136A096C